ncbi:secreted in xylem 2 protein, SIX2 [Rhexocercosporidium sp. MPI-PUGE-AT-0058]|nr:secreted in xylem 2 protein, SIX2 [Rhexocercosporidium sp. MPI-PUGE-AT-0058]
MVRTGDLPGTSHRSRFMISLKSPSLFATARILKIHRNSPLYTMFLRTAIYSSVFLAAVISANPFPSSDYPDSHLPDLRLTREEVQVMKREQIHEPGYVHKYVTLGTGDDAITVPIIEADPTILLSDEEGVKARALAPRGACMSFAASSSSCTINYCWKDDAGAVYSEAIDIRGSNGQSNPSFVTSSSTTNLQFDDINNNGYGGWFPQGHECSNSNTQIYTKHRLFAGVFTSAYVDGVRCNNCNFGRLNCLSRQLKDNLIAYSNGVASQSSCR